MLSEFDIPLLRWLRISRSKNAGWYAALITIVVAGIITIFGHAVGANACGIEVSVTFPDEQGYPLHASRQFISGWLTMANSAPFYLFVAPILMIVTHRFLLSCGEALERLHAAGRMKTFGTRSWNEVMARRNRWCLAPLCLFPFFLYICINTQLASMDRVMKGYPTQKKKWSEVGYVQSIALEGWCKAFNKLDKMDKKIAILSESRYLPDVELAMVRELEGRNARIKPELVRVVTFAAGHPTALNLNGVHDEVKKAIAELVIIQARALRPAKDSWLGWKRYTRGESHTWFPIWFRVFVILGQIMIAIFFTFGVWLTWKILFWLIQVYRLLPGQNGKAQALGPKDLGFEPLLHDPTGRYGLSALFRPYDLLILSATIGASYLALKLPSGVSGSDITNAGGAGSGATALGHLIVISIVIVAVVSGPMIIFPNKLQGWARVKRLNQLAHELSMATNRKHQATLLEEEAIVMKQTTWPVGDTLFKVTMAILLAVLLLPLGSALQFLPGDAVSAIRLPQAMRDSCEEFFAKCYELKAE
jgi:hypothetical protein